MQKIITKTTYTVVVLAAITVFSWAVAQHVKGERMFGKYVHKVLEVMTTSLDIFEQAVEEVQSLPKTFVPTPEGFTAVNELEDDLWVLLNYTNEENSRTAEVRNLKDGAVLHSWKIRNPFQAHNRVMHPVMLPGKRLVYSFLGHNNVWCIDSAGNELWKQESIQSHHSYNLDHNGDIWICTYPQQEQKKSEYTRYYKIDGKKIPYLDNSLTLLDDETGEVLYHKNISELLVENGLEYILLKSNNFDDPIHLNDVEPVLEDGSFWIRGDVFLSFRTNSTVLHFRPSTGKVIKVLEGPFFSQHDVDIIGDGHIALFNNNGQTLYPKALKNYPKSESIEETANFYSSITHYNYATDSFQNKWISAFEENQIATFTEGLFEYLPNGSIFVEEQNSSVLWVLDEGEVVYKDVLRSHHEGHHHLTNWIRILN